MLLYSTSNPPPEINPDWTFWSTSELGRGISPDQISSLLFITRKKEICLIYKPTPVYNDKNELISIIGNMFDKNSSPAFFNIDKDEIGSCYAIREFKQISAKFPPKIALQSDSVKDTDWDEAEVEIALIAIPTLASLPYGFQIKSVIIDNDFIDEMKEISEAHGFWAKTMSDAIDQFEVNNHTELVLKRMMKSHPVSTSRDPARAATKNLRDMTFTSSPFVDVSLLSKNIFTSYQEELSIFFRQNPTPARVEIFYQ